MQILVKFQKKNSECDECKPSRWFMTNPSLVKHIKAYHTHEIEKFKCGYKGCQQLIGSKSALKKHRKWHWDIEEKQRKRDEQIAKEKEIGERAKRKRKAKLKKKINKKSKSYSIISSKTCCSQCHCNCGWIFYRIR